MPGPQTGIVLAGGLQIIGPGKVATALCKIREPSPGPGRRRWSWLLKAERVAMGYSARRLVGMVFATLGAKPPPLSRSPAKSVPPKLFDWPVCRTSLAVQMFARFHAGESHLTG